MDGQKNRYKKTELINKWIVFFLECMVTLIQRLEAKYETYNKLEKVLNKRQQTILKLVKKKKSFAIKDVEIVMPTISRNTLKKDIG